MVHGSNPSGGEIFRTCPDWPWGPSSLLYNGYWVFPGDKERPGCDTDPSPPSSAVVKVYSSTSTPPMGHTECLYKGALYFYLLIGSGSISISSSSSSSSSNSSNSSSTVVVVMVGDRRRRSFIGKSAAEAICIHFSSVSPQGHWSLVSATY